LVSNGFKRAEIKGDGNCFFAAVSHLFKGSTSVCNLRQITCDHLKGNYEYASFLTNGNDSDKDAKVNYHNQVEILRENGQWLVELADVLPLSVANIFGRGITIFSSKSAKPVINIKPTLKEVQVKENIYLALMPLRGFEHYDACVTRTCQDSEEEGSPIKNIEREITPRKQAKKANPYLWKKNIRKLSGQEYLSTGGKTVAAKSVKEMDCSKCRFRCSMKVCRKNREDIFTSFYSLSSYERQKDFLCSQIIQKSPARICVKSKYRKKCSREFYFEIEGCKVRVCKSFFLKTLDVGERVVELAMRDKISVMFKEKDKRGRHSPYSKTPKETIQFVRKHKESFPVVDPHYT
jgi:hypothetical protein